MGTKMDDILKSFYVWLQPSEGELLKASFILFQKHMMHQALTDGSPPSHHHRCI